MLSFEHAFEYQKCATSRGAFFYVGVLFISSVNYSIQTIFIYFIEFCPRDVLFAVEF